MNLNFVLTWFSAAKIPIEFLRRKVLEEVNRIFIKVSSEVHIRFMYIVVKSYLDFTLST